MDDAIRALVALSAAVANRDRELIDAALAEASQRATALQVEEALLQSYLFVGYPASLQALGRWREMSGRAAPAASDVDPEGWARRGEEVCAAVYGGQYERLRMNVRALHPDMEQWMLTEGYGKVLGRPGLDLAARELCIVALLAAQDAPRQLHSHLRGALQVGATIADVDDALRIAGAVAGPSRAATAGRVWNQVRGRRAAED